jgi:hypothetical protein
MPDIIVIRTIHIKRPGVDTRKPRLTVGIFTPPCCLTHSRALQGQAQQSSASGSEALRVHRQGPATVASQTGFWTLVVV